jgi:hypothetical protein
VRGRGAGRHCFIDASHIVALARAKPCLHTERNLGCFYGALHNRPLTKMTWDGATCPACGHAMGPGWRPTATTPAVRSSAPYSCRG